MKKSLGFVLKLLASLIFTFMLLEGGLRLFPEMIALDFLVYFDTAPRREIAQRLGLATEWDTVVLDRDDGGPELRIYKPFTRLIWPIQDHEISLALQMDEIGFCNPENSYQSSPIDIITLGDSFTFCHAVPQKESWANQLSIYTGLSVYNLGKGNIGVQEYLQIFKKFGIPKSPKIVILNIYEGNDLRDARRYFKHIHQLTEPSTPTPRHSPVLRHSYSYNLFYGIYRYIDKNRIGMMYDNDDDEWVETNFRYDVVFPDKTILFNPLNTDRDEVEHANKLYRLTIETVIFDIVADSLKEFVELSKQHDFIPVVTYTPSAHTAYNKYVKFHDETLNDYLPWFSDLQRQYLSQQSGEIGYHFIDLTPTLQAEAQAHGSQELLYYRYDLHLTAAGHKVVAQSIHQALNDLGYGEITVAGREN